LSIPGGSIRRGETLIPIRPRPRQAPEQKRFFVFEVGGKRVVAAIASSNEKFSAQVVAGLAVLESLTFTR
jgi:hypothetical protein